MSKLRPRPTPTTEPQSTPKTPNTTTTTTNTDPDPHDTPKPQIQRQQSLPQRAISQTLSTTASLVNLLPTGTLMAFQLLIPVFTQNGACDSATRPMTLVLLVILALSCFLACFTDTIKSSSDGQVYHGLATFKGLWLFDYPGTESQDWPDLSKYRIKFPDVAHAVLTVLVFGAVAFREKNVVRCFYPTPRHETREFLDIVPIGVGIICSLLFVVFPSRRHGIGYPVTPGK